MDEKIQGTLRPIVATVALGRASVQDDVAQIVVDEMIAANFALVRKVTVNRERQFIEQLVAHIANSNEADVVILIGGVGAGPRDYTCEAVDGLADRRLEGFGEAFRRLIQQELNAGVESLLERATAVVYNKLVVFALPRKPAPLRRAVRDLVLPTAAAAVRIATGGVRSLTS